MLKRFRVNNFRSLLNVEFRPAGVNILIGANNAGKTNLCSALRFLGLTSTTSLESAAKNALGETWNVTNVYVKDRDLEMEVEATLPEQGQEFQFHYSLRMTGGREASTVKQVLRVADESLRVTGGRFSQTILLENKSGAVRLLHERRFLGTAPVMEHYVETSAPLEATMLSRLYDLESNRQANRFKRYLQTWLYYNFSPQSLRSAEVITEYPLIRNDGANLSKVLYTLHNEKPRLEKKIIDLVRTLEPKLDLLSFSSPDPESVYLFFEDPTGNRFSTQSVSDGTLRFLAMAYLITINAAITDGGSASPLIMIEEPENGLYVGYLKALLETIDLAGRCGQFVFTSHSPYFIDLFDSNIEGIHLIKSGKPSSIILRPEAASVRKLLDQIPLGEMHFRELLG